MPSFTERFIEMLKKSNKKDIHEIFSEHMIYIDTKDKVNNTLNYTVIDSCNYSCDQKGCDFSECFQKINDSDNEYEKVFSKKLLEDILVNQENYLAWFLYLSRKQNHS